MAMDQYLYHFLGRWTSINHSYFDVHLEYKVLTHPHICFVYDFKSKSNLYLFKMSGLKKIADLHTRWLGYKGNPGDAA